MSALPQSSFDVTTLPNAQRVTRHLFPNVSVVSDDGTLLRSETRASLQLPIELNGLDTYGLFFAATVLPRLANK